MLKKRWQKEKRKTEEEMDCLMKEVIGLSPQEVSRADEDGTLWT